MRTIHPSQPCLAHPSLPQQIFCLWTTGTSALVIYCFSVSNHCLVVVSFLWFVPVPSLFYSAKECRCKCLEKWMLYQWRIQDSPKGEPTPEGEAQIYYYHPQRSCGKVMFLHVSVTLFTGGSLSGNPPRQRSPWTETPWTETPATETPQTEPPWTDTPSDIDPPDRDPPGQRPPNRTVTSGRYASHWNTFLFGNNFLLKTRWKIKEIGKEARQSCHWIQAYLLGSIHTWDLLHVNPCVNLLLNNGLYCVKWATLVWTEKMSIHFLPIAWTAKFTQ